MSRNIKKKEKKIENHNHCGGKEVERKGKFKKEKKERKS